MGLNLPTRSAGHPIFVEIVHVNGKLNFIMMNVQFLLVIKYARTKVPEGKQDYTSSSPTSLLRKAINGFFV
jgi:hypothetical protein